MSEDFHANAITHKALDILSPQPQVSYQYVSYEGKKIYAIKVDKSDSWIAVEGKIYQRVGASVKLLNPTEIQFKSGGYPRIEIISQQIKEYKKEATNAKTKLIEHYQSILKIIDDLAHMLYPIDPSTPTGNQESR